MGELGGGRVGGWGKDLCGTASIWNMTAISVDR